MSDTVIAPDLREWYERVSKAEQENVALRAERRTILDSVTRHCTPEQINTITADTLAARGREGE